MNLDFKIDRNSPLPIYAQVKNLLAREIERGTLPYGEMIPSENELVRELGISRMTVRSAVSALSEEHYVRTVHGKGSFVCYQSTQTALGTVDVLLDVTYAYFSTHYIKSISEVLSLHNYRFVIHDTQDNQTEIATVIESILQNGSAGIILQASHMVEPSDPHLFEVLKKVNQQKIPLAFLDSDIEGISALRVLFDDFAGGKTAAEYLLSLGHVSTAMVCRNEFKENAPRRDGFNSVLEEKGLPSLVEIQKDKALEENLLRAIRDLGVTALFCYNDDVAMKVIRILTEHGIRIPAEVSVMGFDDTVFAKATTPLLTSVVHPKDLLGRLAAEMLLCKIEKRPYTYPEEILLPRIAIRESCAPAKQTLT